MTESGEAPHDLMELTVERACPAGCVGGKFMRVDEDGKRYAASDCPTCKGAGKVRFTLPCIQIIGQRKL